MIVIPVDQLPADALQGLIEEFVTRDGTDYGQEEMNLAQKVSQVKSQLQRREVLIVYNLADEQANILTRQQYEELQRQVQAVD
ncbi:YheU family protein [Simiduia curdlanivorans]|uniref:YheU family protein n=1 Tax=Simiduia curdlanivorans TaxID=1492769 RepID=A0ABV8V4X4_9GAMM|nr:YheU family protein [Simiduia curdlanivorans]MDN3640169.1 YheU family protein [Simiduia curdlanivorans]